MKQTTAVPTLVLSLVIETHARYRDMQSYVKSMHGINLSVGRIAGIITEAGERAQHWLKQQQAPAPRALAWDEQDSSQRGNATALSGLLWPCIAPFRRGSSRCWLSGIITGWLLVVSMRVFPLSNGRGQPHPSRPAGICGLFPSRCLTVHTCHIVLNHV